MRTLLIIVILGICYDANAQNPSSPTRGNKDLPSSKESLLQLASYENQTYKYAVEDFFIRSKQSSFLLSPDGTYLSYLEKDEKGKSGIFFREIQTGIIKKTIEEKDRQIRGYYWLTEKRLLYYADHNGDENYQLFCVDIESKDEICLTPYDEVSAELLIKPSREHPDEIIVLMNKDDRESAEPYLINFYNGKTKRLWIAKDYGGNIANYYFDKNWNVNAYISIDGENKRVLYYKTSNTKPFKKIIETSATNKFELIGFVDSTEYPHDAYLISNIESNTLEISIFDLMKGKSIKRLFSNKTYDLEGMSISQTRNEIDYYYYKDKRWRNIPVSNRFSSIYKKLTKKLEGYDIIIYSKSKDETKYLLDAYSDKVYHKYFLYDQKKDSLYLLVNLLPHLKEEDMTENHPIRFTTRDGLKIDGYLMIPQNSSPTKPAPLLVNPHGGPFEVRNDWSFNREGQLLASRGYAILQVNFRGSGGYGKKFLMAGFKQIGRKMLDDLEDAVKYVSKLQIIDTTRIGIYGGSYGGLAALGSLIKTPELYTCAVDNCGISNIFTFYNSFPPQWKKLRQKLYSEWYDPSNPIEAKIATEVSPALNTDKIKKPILIVHGANDTRVKIEESDQMVSQLRNKGAEVPYLVKYNEGHGFSREANRMELYKVMLGFFAKHLKQK
jgi:dipeptidyl aminopeptidase/acylaminoacyl peptidase